MSFKMNFRDMPHSETLQSECEALAEQVRSEFPETSHVEVAVHRERDAYEANVHVTGKDVDVDAHGTNRDAIATAVREAFERVHGQLRKHHEKQIQNPRRHAKHKG
jgi:ribosome-associated translation inhibitor RaiA